MEIERKFHYVQCTHALCTVIPEWSIILHCIYMYMYVMCPSSQGWTPISLRFLFDLLQDCYLHVSVLFILYLFGCTLHVGSGFPSFLLSLYGHLSYMYVVCYAHVFSCTRLTETDAATASRLTDLEFLTTVEWGTL